MINRVLTLVLLCCFSQHGIGGSGAGFYPPPHDSDDPLKAWYQQSNKGYFSGDLPDISVYWASLPKGSYAATLCSPSWPETGNAETCQIRISDKFQKPKFLPIANWAVLHESCHVEIHRHARPESYDPHGREFQACMLRLANAGAFTTLW